MVEPKYIDATALDTRVSDSMNLSTHLDPVLKLMHIQDHRLFRAMIAEAPIVDVAPVVHAKWEFGATGCHGWMKCSSCLHSQDRWTGVFAYCPSCGARMDLEVNSNGWNGRI